MSSYLGFAAQRDKPTFGLGPSLPLIAGTGGDVRGLDQMFGDTAIGLL